MAKVVRFALIGVILALIGIIITSYRSQPIILKTQPGDSSIYLELSPGYYGLPNQSITASWKIDRIKGIYLNEGGVIGQDSRDLTVDHCSVLSWEIVFTDDSSESYSLQPVLIWTMPSVIILVSLIVILVSKLDIALVSSILDLLNVKDRHQVFQMTASERRRIFARSLIVSASIVLAYAGLFLFPLSCQLDANFIFQHTYDLFKIPTYASELIYVSYGLCLIASAILFVQLYRKSAASVSCGLQLLGIAIVLYLVTAPLRPQITDTFRIYIWAFPFICMASYGLVVVKMMLKPSYFRTLSAATFIALTMVIILTNIINLNNQSWSFDVLKSNRLEDLNRDLYDDGVILLREHFYGYQIYAPTNLTNIHRKFTWAGLYLLDPGAELHLTAEQATAFDQLSSLTADTSRLNSTVEVTLVIPAPVLDSTDKTLWAYEYEDRAYILSRELIP